LKCSSTVDAECGDAFSETKLKEPLISTHATADETNNEYEKIHVGLIVSENYNCFFVYSSDFGPREPCIAKVAYPKLQLCQWIEFTAVRARDYEIAARGIRVINHVFPVQHVRKTVEIKADLYVPDDYNITERHLDIPPHILNVFDQRRLLSRRHLGRQLVVVLSRGKCPESPRASWRIEKILEEKAIAK